MKKFSNLILENSNGKSFDKDDLLFIFAHTFDLSAGYIIDNVYFHPETNEYAGNDFSSPNSNIPYCVKGYAIDIQHSFYNQSELEDFNKYLLIVNELKSDLDRFMDIYGFSYIGFAINASSMISVIIKPIDYRK